MKAKALSVIAVAILSLTAFAVISMDGSDAAPSSSMTVHPVPENNPWVSKKPLLYLSGLSEMYFEDDPYNALLDYAHGTITLDQLKTILTTLCWTMRTEP